MTKILVIDDDEQLRRYIAVLLRRHRFDVAEAADGDKGILYLAKHPVDLIITDLIMPEKEGVATIREARKLHPAIKIIVISGSGANAERFLPIAMKLGANIALTKPFRPEELLSAVRSLATPA
jgi:DNA-binding response OmpR family regulator